MPPRAGARQGRRKPTPPRAAGTGRSRRKPAPPARRGEAGPPEADSTARRVGTEPPADREAVLLACLGDEAAGFVCGALRRSVCYAQPHGEITELYVREPFRRQGVARALLRRMEELLAQKGARETVLLTSPANAGARRFYEGCGFSGRPELLYKKATTDPAEE